MTQQQDGAGWNVETLRHLMQLQIADVERMMSQQVNDLRTMLDERYATQTKALDAAFSAQQTAMQTALTAAKQAVETALSAQEKAVDKAEAAAEKRFDAFRIETDMRIKVVSDEQDATQARNSLELAEIRSRLDKGWGKESGATDAKTLVHQGWLLAAALVGVVISIISAAVAIYTQTHH